VSGKSRAKPQRPQRATKSAKAPAKATPPPAAPSSGVEPEIVFDWVLRVAAAVVGCLIAAVFAILGGFLTAFQIGDVLVPVSWGVAAVGAAAAVFVAGYGSGVPVLAVLPGLVWSGITLALASPAPGGDVVMPGTWVAYGSFLVGIGSFVGWAYVLVVLADRARIRRLNTPEGDKSTDGGQRSPARR
jgi:hypothetical protein